jgi:hypothetical protein
MAKNAGKKEAEPQQTPKAEIEESKGARYLTKPVRLADLPRFAGCKPVEPSRRLFMKLTFVALAAPGSFTVMPGRGYGAHPGCNDLEGDLGDPRTGLCWPMSPNDCNPTTPNSIRTCKSAPGARNTNADCTAADRNVCVGTDANKCGVQAGTTNTCSGPGANECKDDYQSNVCHHSGSNECAASGPAVSNSCGTNADSINTCNLSGANTCGTGSTAPNSCNPADGGNASTA